MLRKKVILGMLACLLVATTAGSVMAGDWPMSRYDANRSGVSPDNLPATLELQWLKELPKLEPAWDEQFPGQEGDNESLNGHTANYYQPDEQERRMKFDRAYTPVVTGSTLLLNSTFDDSITAYDTATGNELWVFRAEGPIRCAPAVANGKVYACSDDGNLYCLSVADGSVQWTYDGGLLDRKVVGNNRLVDMYPSRVGPVVHDGAVYCCFGIWPFMGVVVSKVDANTGSVIWTNDGTGELFSNQPHAEGPGSFGGTAPQGNLAACPESNTLMVPCGRAAPAAFNMTTGEFMYYTGGTDENSGSSKCFTAAKGDKFIAGERIWNIADGSLDRRYCPPNGDFTHYNRYSKTVVMLDEMGLDGAALTDTLIYTWDGYRTWIEDPCATQHVIARDWTLDPCDAWGDPCAINGDIHALVKAGDRLYVCSDEELVALDAANGDRVWSKPFVGTAINMAAADDKLFIATEEGYVYCYGDTDNSVTLPDGNDVPAPAIDWPAADEYNTKAQDIIATTGQSEGFCILLGLGNGRLAEALAQESDMIVIAVEDDASTVTAMRQHWAEMDLPPARVCVVDDTFAGAGFAPYMANLILITDDYQGALPYMDQLLYSTRPYGGTICVDNGTEGLGSIDFDSIATMEGVQSTTASSYSLITRDGALTGAGYWTHNNADVSNTMNSGDQLVKEPMGLLHFGNVSNRGALPRHTHGPHPLVCGGRVFMEGIDYVQAHDAYTGRLMWQYDIPKVGWYARFAHNTHEASANHCGGNMAACMDSLYVVSFEGEIYRIDAATGELLGKFDDRQYHQIRIWEDKLVCTAGPRMIGHNDPNYIGLYDDWSHTSSEQVVCLDRTSGLPLWSKTAENAFLHNTLVIGGNDQHETVYCIDTVTPQEKNDLENLGDPVPNQTVYAWDVATGTEQWSVTDSNFASWLAYSGENDLLCRSGRASRDDGTYEPSGQYLTYNGQTGAMVNEFDTTPYQGHYGFEGPFILHHDTVFAECRYSGEAFNIHTGNPLPAINPLTGENDAEWKYVRHYGCNHAIASEHMITFRSAAAGYCDIDSRMTGNFGGIKTGCTNNIMPADGVINIPEYTRGCVCAAQMQSSLGLVHMPEVEVWSFSTIPSPDPCEEITRAAVNFGAPGHRMSDTNVYWFCHPNNLDVKNKSTPATEVSISDDATDYFRNHSMRFVGQDKNWVTTCGAVGASHIEVNLGNSFEREYRVRLYFAEPAGAAPGGRVFSVSLQGTEVLTDLDIAAEAGSAGDPLVKEIEGVMVSDVLTIDFTGGESVICGVEIMPLAGQLTHGDWFVDMYDFQQMVDQWLTENDVTLADIDEDGDVDVVDLQRMVYNWLQGS